MSKTVAVKKYKVTGYTRKTKVGGYTVKEYKRKARKK